MRLTKQQVKDLRHDLNNPLSRGIEDDINDVRRCVERLLDILEAQATEDE